jgi:hypothetical protein
MRSMLCLVLALSGCKGDKEAPKPKASDTQASRETAPPELPQVEEVLPADFPLPDSPGKKLVRAQKKLTMTVWEYLLPDVSAANARMKISEGLRSAEWEIESIETADNTHSITAINDGRLYAVAVTPADAGSRVTIRSFPEAGPTTLNAPASYPTRFPFLAGGTASHAPDGAKLTIAYQSDPRDIEQAMIVAAKAAGWTCKGTGSVTCTQDKSNVTFTTEEARGGSLLVVSAP